MACIQKNFSNNSDKSLEDGYITDNSCDFDNEFLRVQIPSRTGTVEPASAIRFVS